MEINRIQQPHILNYSQSVEIIKELTIDAHKLQNGFTIMIQYEKFKNFYINLLKILFDNENNDKCRKLASSIVKIFIKKNWLDTEYISNDEKTVNYIKIG